MNQTFPLDPELSDPASYQALFDRLTQPLLFLKDSGVASKNFNDWRRAGLWFDDANEKRTWTKLSLEQHIWLKMLQQLRQLGCSTDLILKVKQQLLSTLNIEDYFMQQKPAILAAIEKSSMEPDEKIKQLEAIQNGDMLHALKESEEGKQLSSSQSILRSLLFAAFLKHQHVAVLVYPDGSVTPWLDEIHHKDPASEKLFKRSHIYLSITEHLLEFLTNPAKEVFISPLQLLNAEEWQVLRALRDNTLKEITIQLQMDPKSRKISKIMYSTKEGILQADDREAILEILLNKKYNGIEFKRRTGNRLYFEKESQHIL